jgi:hypothetical protein
MNAPNAASVVHLTLTIFSRTTPGEPYFTIFVTFVSIYLDNFGDNRRDMGTSSPRRSGPASPMISVAEVRLSHWENRWDAKLLAKLLGDSALSSICFQGRYSRVAVLGSLFQSR